MSSELLNVKDLARLLRMSVRTVWRLRSAGRLPKPVRIGKSVRWSPETIEAWIDLGCPDRAAFEARSRTAKKEGGKQNAA